jgi:outer membrane immunogenic protein
MKERPMRWVFCLAMMLGTATPALAADYDLPILRGSEPPAPVVTVGPATFTRWSGFYVGGVASYNNATTDFINATQPLIAFSLRATTLEQQVHPSGIAVLGKGAGSAFGGGAFLGYNTQWQDLSRRSLDIAFVSEFQPDCRGCVRTVCTRTGEQNG